MTKINLVLKFNVTLYDKIVREVIRFSFLVEESLRKKYALTFKESYLLFLIVLSSKTRRKIILADVVVF